MNAMNDVLLQCDTLQYNTKPERKPTLRNHVESLAEEEQGYGDCFLVSDLYSPSWQKHI